MKAWRQSHILRRISPLPRRLRLNLGSGINDVQLGRRLRYEIGRALASCVGVNWMRRIDNTANIA